MNKHKQKIKLSALLVVLAALMSLVVLADADGAHCAEADCSGTYENGFCTSNGDHYQAAVLNNNGTPDDTTDDCYEIGNAGQLYWFAAKVNSDNLCINDQGINGKLTANIIVNPGRFSFDPNNDPNEIVYFPENDEKLRNWLPIGEGVYGKNYTVGVVDEKLYIGTFDGNGKTISGLYCSGGEDDDCFIGLFGHIYNATIKDLGITNSAFDAQSGGFCGSLVAYAVASGSGTCMITNCYTDANVIVRAAPSQDPALYCGSLGGYLNANHDTAQLTVTGCRADGLIYICPTEKLGNDSQMVGGLFGNITTGFFGQPKIDISDCHNQAEVVINCEQAVGVGGLIGYCTSDCIINISGCHNEGELTLNDVSLAKAGGLIGSVTSSSKITPCKVTLKNCYNTGNGYVKSERESYYGGLVGHLSTQYFIDFNIESCYNTGNGCIESNATSSYYGGLVGYINGVQNSMFSIKSCYSTGDGDAVLNDYDYIKDVYYDTVFYCGGVIGLCNNSKGETTLSDLYYLPTQTVKAGIYETKDTDGIIATNAEQFKSGEVTWLLNGNRSEGTKDSPLVWKQVISAAPSDESPKFEGFTVKYDEANKKYYNDIPILPWVKGAQIRNDSKYGLRFGFVYDGGENAVAEYKNISYGALLVPQDIIGTKAITLETAKTFKDNDGKSKIANVERERDFDNSNKNAIVYTAVLHDIPYVSETDNKYAVDIVAVPYVKFTFGDIEYTAYGEKIVRSVNQVKEIMNENWSTDANR